jgi:myo-inositol-1(or 4)-monophosphatase
VDAARAAGRLMRDNLRSPKKVNEASRHDIKLELDVQCQALIERVLRRAFPGFAVLGEEGVQGDAGSAWRWVVDPIDGTVNFSYGIPHACVAIALQAREATPLAEFRKAEAAAHPDAHYRTLAGVVYDPFCDELWTAQRGQPARLNGRPIRVSRRRRLSECLVALGFAKERASLEKMVPTFNALIRRVRKLRLMGSAALSLVYVASGRKDAYVEYGLRLWDVAAGGLMVECAGGRFWYRPAPGKHIYRIVAHNGFLLRPLLRLSSL